MQSAACSVQTAATVYVVCNVQYIQRTGSLQQYAVVYKDTILSSIEY